MENEKVLLLCNSREQQELPDIHKDNGVGLYTPAPTIARDRLNCMNLRTYSTPFVQFKYCIACNKWGTTKGWNKGFERDNWRRPSQIYRALTFTLTLVSIMSILSPFIYLSW